MGRTRLIRGGKSLVRMYVRREQTGSHTGLGDDWRKKGRNASNGMRNAPKPILVKPKLRRGQRGPAGMMRCPRCGRKINRSQLDSHLLRAHGLA